jgi:hypothetical protein
MKLDWKWIGLGFLIMIVLSVLAGIILVAVLVPSLKGVTDPSQVQLTSGQLAVAALLNFLAFVIGGYLVGVKSAGRTILEPAIAAAVAVAVGLVLSRNFTLGNMLAGGLVPFLAGLLGGWLGEKRQDAKRVPTG